MTSKLQVTIPKSIADQYAIAPGDDVEFIGSAESVRRVPAKAPKPVLDVAARLRLFDAATERQRARERESGEAGASTGEGRGWTREELYRRGSAG